MNKQKGIIETLLLLGLTVIGVGLFLYEKQSKSMNSLGAIPNEVAFFEDSLASKITSTQTTMTLVKGTNKTGNIASSTYGFVIDEGSAQEEVVICDCTATACTNCKRGISDVDGQTETTALKFEHRRGAVVKMTDHPSLVRLIRSVNGTDAIDGTMYYKTSPSSPSSTAVIDRAWLDTTSTANFVYKTGDQTIAGQKTFSGTTTFDKNITIPLVPVALTDATSKQYVDGVAIAGAPSSSETVYGISKLSVAPANANFPIAVGQNDPILDKDFTASEFIAGEDISKNDAISVCNKDNSVIYSSTSTEQLDASVYLISSALAFYQSFTAPSGNPVFYSASLLFDEANPGGGEAMTMYLSSTTATTTALFSCSSLFNGSISTGNIASCATSTGINLVGGSTYYLIVDKQGYALKPYGTTTNAFSGGAFGTSTNGASWQEEANKDAVIQVYYLTGDENKAYKTGTFKYRTYDGTLLSTMRGCRYNFIGFSSDDYSSGDTVTIKTSGIATGFSGLDTSTLIRTKYYSNYIPSTSTSLLGSIVTSGGASEVGYAINSSTILINNLDHK